MVSLDLFSHGSIDCQLSFGIRHLSIETAFVWFLLTDCWPGVESVISRKLRNLGIQVQILYGTTTVFRQKKMLFSRNQLWQSFYCTTDGLFACQFHKLINGRLIRAPPSDKLPGDCLPLLSTGSGSVLATFRGQNVENVR